MKGEKLVMAIWSRPDIKFITHIKSLRYIQYSAESMLAVAAEASCVCDSKFVKTQAAEVGGQILE